jgi:hypothetical protein
MSATFLIVSKSELIYAFLFDFFVGIFEEMIGNCEAKCV